MLNVNNLESNVAWVAGLLEADGCFHDCRGYPEIAVEMGDKDTVEKYASFTNNAVTKKVRKNKPTWKPTYVTACSGQKAIDIMHLVYPHMSIRRKERIDEIIERFHGKYV